MTESDILLTVAELAVAFAGFASLAGILGQRRSSDSVNVNTVRLQAMLESALVVFVFALLPFLPELFGFSETAAFRIAAVGFVTINLIRLVAFARGFSKFREGGIIMKWTVVVVSMQVTSILALLAVSIDVVGEHTAAAYILALFLILFASGVFFLRLAVGLLASQSDSS